MNARIGKIHQLQIIHGVREPRLERPHQYQEMCGTEDVTCGADAIEFCGAVSQTRGAQGEKHWEASAGGYSFTRHGRRTFWCFTYRVRTKQVTFKAQTLQSSDASFGR
jgi:hypothetical protein